MPRKPTKHDNPEQSKRFIEMAERVGANDDDVVESTLKKIKSSTKGSPATIGNKGQDKSSK